MSMPPGRTGHHTPRKIIDGFADPESTMSPAIPGPARHRPEDWLRRRALRVDAELPGPSTGSCISNGDVRIAIAESDRRCPTLPCAQPIRLLERPGLDAAPLLAEDLDHAHEFPVEQRERVTPAHEILKAACFFARDSTLAILDLRVHRCAAGGRPSGRVDLPRPGSRGRRSPHAPTSPRTSRCTPGRRRNPVHRLHPLVQRRSLGNVATGPVSGRSGRA